MNNISRRAALAAMASGAGGLGSASAEGSEGGSPHSGLDERPRVDHHTTEPGAELIRSLTLAFDPYRYSTLYSLMLPGLRKGDVVQAHCQFEVTNDLGFNVMLAHAMLIHPKETIVSHSDRPQGAVLCEYAGENVTPGMHHGFRTLVGSIAATQDGNAWVSVLIYSASTSAKPGDKIAVEHGYGGLRAIVYRNNVPSPQRR